MPIQTVPTSMLAQDGGIVSAHIGSAAIARSNMSADGAIPAGVVWPYAGSAAPSGWLLANGAAVSRSTYASLFAAISTTYGVGDGSTTFNLPDCTGRSIAGKEASATRLTSAGGGVDGATLGAVGGTETHTLAIGQIPSHSHSVQGYNTGSVVGSATTVATGVSGASPNTVTTTTQGSGSAHPNVQPTIVLNYIIKT